MWIKLLQLLAVSAGVPYLVFKTSYNLDTAILLDVPAPLIAGFIVYATNDEYSWAHARPRIQTLIILMWAARFSIFLLLRNIRMPQKRFRTVTKEAMEVAFVLQGLLVFLKTLPTLFMITVQYQPDLTLQDAIGWSIGIIGLAVETFADYLKALRTIGRRKSRHERSRWFYSFKGRVIGENMFWFGLYVSASTVHMPWWIHSIALGLVLVDAIYRRGSLAFEHCGRQME